MKYLALLILLVGCNNPLSYSTSQPSSTCAPIPMVVHFSPKGGCTEQVVQLIQSAQYSIYVQAYSFTSQPIGDALIAAHSKVQVSILLDRSDRTNHSYLSHFKAAGIDTKIDASHPIAHNKVLIVDEHLVETGSFNYTKQAESNAENCIVIDSKELAQEYLENWKKHQAHSLEN